MSQVQEVKAASDIVAVIGQRLPLQRSGAYFKCPCPFHSEKTPSFFISEQMQRYKCFGCGKSGDVISFLEEYEGMSFLEALEFLAKEAGITLQKFRPSEQDDERQQLLGILDLAREYYHYLLTKHEAGQPARDYLKERGVSQASIKLWQLGYSLDGWQGLINYLHKKKRYSLVLLEKAGLIARKAGGGRAYDRFRGRLMFPLKNHRGQVVGFSGRLLDAGAKEAKYINSPETELYHKSQMLYGYSELYQEIRKAEQLIVCEGEFDVISSAQLSVNNVVAIKGSALTPEHVRLMKRAVSKVILALDTDAAGIEATKRAIPLVQKEGLELRVLQVPAGKDVDELARTDPAAWRKASKTSESVYAFLIDRALAEHNAGSPEGKRAIINELAPQLEHIPHQVEKEFYVKDLARKLETRVSVLQADLQRFGKGGALKQAAGGTAASQQSSEEDGRSAAPVSPTEKIERVTLGLLYRLWEVEGKRPPALGKLELETARLQPLLTACLDNSQASGVPAALAEDQRDLLMELLLSEDIRNLESAEQLQEASQTALRRLRQQSLKKKVAEITRQLEQLEPDDPQQEALLAEIVQLRQGLA